MATNELGHRLAALVGDQLTLGAYRLGHRLPWATGATIDLWAACPRAESVTGVPAPHVLFRWTRGDYTVNNGSLFCPECCAELAALRASGQLGKTSASPPPPPRVAPPRPVAPVDVQLLELPF